MNAPCVECPDCEVHCDGELYHQPWCPTELSRLHDRSYYFPMSDAQWAELVAAHAGKPGPAGVGHPHGGGR